MPSIAISNVFKYLGIDKIQIIIEIIEKKWFISFI